MERKKKIRRPGSIIGGIVLVLILPLLFIYGPWLPLAFVSITEPDADDIRREAQTFYNTYRNTPIESDADFISRYIELAPHIVLENNLNGRFQPYLDKDDVYELIGEPTFVDNPALNNEDDQTTLYTYDYFPYIAQIEADEDDDNTVHLDYYTDIYYDAFELDALFFQVVNDYRTNQDERMPWIQEFTPSKIRQSTSNRNHYSGYMYFLTAENHKDSQQFTLRISDHFFEFYPEIAQMGEIDFYDIRFVRTNDTEPAQVDSDFNHLIESHIGNNNDSRTDLNQLGTTASEISTSLNQAPFQYTLAHREINFLTIEWLINHDSSDKPIIISASVDIEDQPDLTKDILHALPVRDIEIYYHR